MAIKRPEELDFSDKTFTMIIAGAPGIGKTTLALSAPDPLLFDLDRGISRVRAEHRKLASEADSYEELLADMESDAYPRPGLYIQGHVPRDVPLQKLKEGSHDRSAD